MGPQTYPIDEFIRNLFDGGDHIAFKTATLQYNCAELDKEETLYNIRYLAEGDFDRFVQPHELHSILRGLNFITRQYLLLTPESYGNLLATLLTLFYNTMDSSLHKRITVAQPSLDFNVFLRGDQENATALSSIYEKMKTLCRREQTESSTEILELLEKRGENVFDELVNTVVETRQELFRERDQAYVPESYIKQDCTRDGLIYFLWDILSRFWEGIANSGKVGNIIDTWEKMLKYEDTTIGYRFPDLMLFVPPNSNLQTNGLLKNPVELEADVFQPTADGNKEWNSLGVDSKNVLLMYLCLADLTTTLKPKQLMNIIYQSKDTKLNFSKLFLYEWTRIYTLSLSDDVEKNCHLGDGGKTIPAPCWAKLEVARQTTDEMEPFETELHMVKRDSHLYHTGKLKVKVDEGPLQEVNIRVTEKKEESSVVPLVVGVCAAGLAFYAFSE